MYRLALIFLMLTFLSFPAYADDIPMAQVFGGFSVSHRSNDNNSLTYTGWQANASFHLRQSIGLVADFSGQYKTDEDSQLYYMAGPRFTVRKNRLTYFAEALFGADHVPGRNLLAMGYGGGVDLPKGKFSIRLIQFDWIPLRLGNDLPWVKNNTRLGFGVVIPFGTGN